MFALFLFAVFRAPLFVSSRLALSFAFHDSLFCKGTGLSGRFLLGLGEPTRLPGMTGSWVVGVPAARCQSWRDTLVPSLARISGRAGTLSEAPH